MNSIAEINSFLDVYSYIEKSDYKSLKKLLSDNNINLNKILSPKILAYSSDNSNLSKYLYSTPLYYAILLGNIKIINLLLNYGASLHTTIRNLQGVFSNVQIEYLVNTSNPDPEITNLLNKYANVESKTAFLRKKAGVTRKVSIPVFGKVQFLNTSK